MKENKDLIILHDVDGRIYFEALKKLSDDKLIGSIKYRETSVLKKMLSAIIKRKDVSLWFKRGLSNTLFRLQLPFLKNKTIIFGIAPYNLRFAFYGLLGIRNNIIYHTSWPYWWGDNVPYPYNGKNLIIKNIFKFYLNNLNFKVVGVTEPCIESISSELTNSKLECSFIPHAVNIDLFKHDGGEKNSAKKILYVGRLVKEKGVFELAEAIRELDSEYTFTIVGAGVEEKKLVSELNQFKNVEFLGHIAEKSKVAEVFKQHDILVLPSKKIDGWEELFGLVIIEAMACGLIVIASDHIGPRGIISNGKNGFLISDVNLKDNLIKSINNLKDMELDFIRAGARKTAMEYDINNIKRKWSEVINEVQH
ncbi:glycosyltransferase family 4 protein [Erwinia sp. INIA-01]|uniref:glycosyltransferase family 4 protein n=1 Tax=Erwinia sp. INIA01 TaxID=2991500 RepID=UPI002224393C|nr:glycosyltransferase family 4 protein [Erwinia sp. INIA01]MCW1874111.1 glycosyltransferase family 4 protein [Erwinia sp. INIA01]